MGSAGVGWRNGEKRHTTVIEYNKNFFKKRKEQIKTPEKELSNEEMDNLSDAKFKTLVIRMLTEMVEYGCKIEEKVKAMLSEIKENVQGTNSVRKESRTQINSLD